MMANAPLESLVRVGEKNEHEKPVDREKVK